MVTVRTELNNTKEAARLERFEPTGNVSATDVQNAIQQVDAEAAGKVPQVGTARLPTNTSSVSILNTDIEVGITTSTQSVTCSLPSVVAWAAANPNGLELTIFDYSNNAQTNNINFALNGSDTVVQGTAPSITANSGLVKLRPIIGASNQWYVRGLN